MPHGNGYVQRVSIYVTSHHRPPRAPLLALALIEDTERPDFRARPEWKSKAGPGLEMKLGKRPGSWFATG
ncbi:hypothetical protein EVAR_12600_1 [Eumeta japonica]|uniref:Uncharacterized protein n=1 Tax=Eumeta variegata TaxID=151549 RepID=A0A4C1UEM1_EUMVA|nr:hypothetical protein EVAR_12600_1 [Eumeta japonica]